MVIGSHCEYVWTPQLTTLSNGAEPECLAGFLIRRYTKVCRSRGFIHSHRRRTQQGTL